MVMFLFEFLLKVKFFKYVYFYINISIGLCYLNVDERFFFLIICFILLILKNNFMLKVFIDRYFLKCLDLIFFMCVLNIF